MKKFYSLLAVIAVTVSANFFAQTKTITLTTTSITDAGAALGANNYNSGAERAWTQNSISLGGKAITNNPANSPTGATAGQYIQMQANNGVIYNTVALPGRLVSVTLNSGGTAQQSSLYGGSTTRLVSNTAADYAVTGTQVGSASATGWTSSDLTGKDYTFFVIKRGASASYLSSIVIEYEDPTMAVGDTHATKANLVKNTVVSNDIIFGSAAKVSIYNAAGQVVKTAEVAENGKLDVSALAKGTYIVTGIVNGQTVSQKIIKK